VQVEIDVRVHPLPVVVIMRSGPMIFRVVQEPRYSGELRHQRGKLWRAYVVVEFGIDGADISHIVPREFFAAVAKFIDHLCGVRHWKLPDQIRHHIGREEILDQNMPERLCLGKPPL
jgi:hypothetical protein